MTIYDMMQKYGNVKADNKMWDVICLLSEYVEDMRYYDEELADDLYDDIYSVFNERL